MSVSPGKAKTGLELKIEKIKLFVFNHFENIRGLCTKTGLIRSLKKYYNIMTDLPLS